MEYVCAVVRAQNVDSRNSKIRIDCFILFPFFLMSEKYRAAKAMAVMKERLRELPEEMEDGASRRVF